MGADPPPLVLRPGDVVSVRTGRRHRIVVHPRYSQRIVEEVLARYGLSDWRALLSRALELGDGNDYLNREELEAAARALVGQPGEMPRPRYSERVLAEVLARYGLSDEKALLARALELGDANRYLNRAELEAAARALSLPELARGVPADWQRAILPALEAPGFAELDAFLADERTRETVYPPPELIWNALRHTPLDAVKVVLLGQDPYHGPGEAMGLSFSVPRGIPIPSSLRNIFTELESDVGATPPDHGDLSAWAERGVLLLNAVLTVRKDQPASHRRQGWEEVTSAILKAVNEKRERVVFLLLGRDAQKQERFVDLSRHAVVKASHPSWYSMDGFLKKRPFSKVNKALEDGGRSPIDWQLPP